MIERNFYGMESVASFDEQRDELGEGLHTRQEEAIDAFGGDE